jgi:hypothetical protein
MKGRKKITVANPGPATAGKKREKKAMTAKKRSKRRRKARKHKSNPSHAATTPKKRRRRGKRRAKRRNPSHAHHARSHAKKRRHSRAKKKNPSRRRRARRRNPGFPWDVVLAPFAGLFTGLACEVIPFLHPILAKPIVKGGVATVAGGIGTWLSIKHPRVGTAMQTAALDVVAKQPALAAIQKITAHASPTAARAMGAIEVNQLGMGDLEVEIGSFTSNDNAYASPGEHMIDIGEGIGAVVNFE